MKMLSKRLFAVLILLTVLAAGISGEEKQKRSFFSIGAGYGVPYGVIGCQVELNPIAYIGICGGLGFAIEGLGYAGGIRIYPLGKERTWTPFVSGYAGVVGVILDHDVFTGSAFGGGVHWGESDNYSFSVEILYLSFKEQPYVDYGGKIKFALGGQWHF